MSQNIDNKIIQAVPIQKPPAIDGEVLDDPVWKNIPPVDGFVQSKPLEGKNASEKTEVRIAYTPTTIYISAICYDSRPEKLVVTDNRRDASLDDMDAFLVILDTYHDRQNGFMFGTNSTGLEYDAQVVNEGLGGIGGNRQQRGNISGFNLNWDGVWEVKSKTGDFGWSTEFAIPLKTLRFSSGKNKTWGINFRRNISKNVEIDYWKELPIPFDLKRVSLAGTLEGLDLVNPGNLKFIPYVLGKAISDKNNTGNSTGLHFDGEAGADIKYSVTPSMTLDLTYNTDFAQVEVDEQQVNLDRFNLFFPEKRSFFLENAGIFSIGSPGEVDIFFSRRIGIGENGTEVPIIGGARLSGKINKTNIGLLSMFTDQVSEKDIPSNNFSMARVNHEFRQRSSIGAAFINKQSLGGDVDHFNRTYALDGKYGVGKKAQLSGYYAKTESVDDRQNEYAYHLNARYDWDGWILNAGYTEVGDGFNPEVGFLQRKGFRKPNILIFKRIRFGESSPFLEIRPHVSYRGYWDFDGFQETGYLHIDNHWVWKNGLEIHTGINFRNEGVKEDFSLVDDVVVPAGTYKHSEAQLVFRTNASKKISLSTFHTLGGFFGGKKYANRISLTARLGDKFTTTISLNNNIVRLPYGDFDTNILSGKFSYSFTSRMFAQALVQYNSVRQAWTSNIRFGYLQDANSGLFLVVNTGSTNNSFLVKYSRVFDLL